MMPNGDPRDDFFYTTLTLMIDSYNLSTHVATTSVCSKAVVLFIVCWCSHGDCVLGLDLYRGSYMSAPLAADI